MKALFIGGTGTISTAISKRVLEKGWELYLLNRGNRNRELEAAGKDGKLIEISCDIRSEDEAAISAKVKKTTTTCCIGRATTFAIVLFGTARRKRTVFVVLRDNYRFCVFHRFSSRYVIV